MAVVSAQKSLDNKESTESDLVNAPGEKSQSHLTLNLETESFETHAKAETRLHYFWSLLCKLTKLPSS